MIIWFCFQFTFTFCKSCAFDNLPMRKMEFLEWDRFSSWRILDELVLFPVGADQYRLD